MSKAILIIDMPESCRHCPYFMNRYNDMYCVAEGRTINYPFPVDFKQDWCPLKSLPEEDNDEHISEWGRGYQGGWNDCINAIVGDKND